MLEQIDKLLEKVNDFLTAPFRKIFPMRTETLIFFTYQMAVMMNVGIGLYVAVEIIKEQTDDKTLKEVAGYIRADILRGVKLSEALSRHPAVFSDFYINTIKAGEKGGALIQSMFRLAETLERDYNFSRKIKSVMIYPFIVFFATLIISFLVLTHVFPKFRFVFDVMKVPLPALTRLFFLISALFANFFFFVFFAALIWIIYTAIKVKLKNPFFKYRVDLLKTFFPVFGAIYRKIVLVRISQALATLIKAGVHILPALELAGKSCYNEVYNNSLLSIRDNVKSGKELAPSFAEEGRIYPSFFVHMFAVAEESGKIDSLLPRVALIMQEEVEYALNNLANILGPVLIAVTGIVVCIAVLAVYLPLNAFISQAI